jgi:hypothetical protein
MKGHLVTFLQAQNVFNDAAWNTEVIYCQMGKDIKVVCVVSL